MNKETYIDFSWPKEITREGFNNIELDIENLLKDISGFDDLDHANMFYHKKYRLRIVLEEMED